MFATPAYAQAALPGAPGGADFFGPFLLPLALIVLFYFMILRPQQKRMKEHQAMIAGVKRGDTVVLSSGIIGKVTKVDETEVHVDIATGVNVKVVKSTLSEVRTRGEPAPANDAKS
jgi:preprotein translocase subunit YajC